MKKTKLLAFVAVITIFASCGTTKQTATIPVVTPPEGIEFRAVENFKGFSLINLPITGNGFSENKSANVRTNQTDAGIFIPGVDYEANHMIYKSSISDTEGDLDIQFEAVKKNYFKHITKENSELIYEKKKVGASDVALVKLTTLSNSGMLRYSYGYIVPHENKAAIFLFNDVLVNEANMQKYDSDIDAVMQYMIKTVKF